MLTDDPDVLYWVVVVYEHQGISVLLTVFHSCYIYKMSTFESESKVMRKFAKHRNTFPSFPSWIFLAGKEEGAMCKLIYLNETVAF